MSSSDNSETKYISAIKDVAEFAQATELNQSLIDNIFGKGTVDKLVYAVENSILETTNKIDKRIREKVAQNLTQENDVHFDIGWNFSKRKGNTAMMTLVMQVKEGGEIKNSIIDEQEIDIKAFDYKGYMINFAKMFKKL